MSKIDEIRELLEKGAKDGDKSEIKDQGAGSDDGTQSASGADPDAGAGQGETGNNDQAASEEAETETQQAEPLKLDALAEKLGKRAADLYETVDIPIGNGQYMRLGELKDLALEGKKALESIDEVRGQADDKHRELMIQRKDVLDLADLVGPQLSPEALDQFKAYRAKQQGREARLLLDALPGWRDPATAKREENSIFAMAAKYGISRPEAEALLNDHRLIKLVRDASLSTQPAQKAAPKPAPRRPADPRRDAYKRGLEAKTKQDKLAAIAQLVG